MVCSLIFSRTFIHVQWLSSISLTLSSVFLQCSSNCSTVFINVSMVLIDVCYFMVFIDFYMSFMFIIVWWFSWLSMVFIDVFNCFHRFVNGVHQLSMVFIDFSLVLNGSPWSSFMFKGCSWFLCWVFVDVPRFLLMFPLFIDFAPVFNIVAMCWLNFMPSAVWNLHIHVV